MTPFSVYVNLADSFSLSAYTNGRSISMPRLLYWTQATGDFWNVSWFDWRRVQFVLFFCQSFRCWSVAFGVVLPKESACCVAKWGYSSNYWSHCCLPSLSDVMCCEKKLLKEHQITYKLRSWSHHLGVSLIEADNDSGPYSLLFCHVYVMTAVVSLLERPALIIDLTLLFKVLKWYWA